MKKLTILLMLLVSSAQAIEVTPSDCTRLVDSNSRQADEVIVNTDQPTETQSNAQIGY